LETKRKRMESPGSSTPVAESKQEEEGGGDGKVETPNVNEGEIATNTTTTTPPVEKKAPFSPNSQRAATPNLPPPFPFGEFVWARFFKFPYWPAIVMDPQSKTVDDRMRKSGKPQQSLARFFGSFDLGWVPFSNIKSYEQGKKEELGKQGKTKAFLKAVKEAEEYANNGVLPVPFASMSTNREEEESEFASHERIEKVVQKPASKPKSKSSKPSPTASTYSSTSSPSASLTSSSSTITTSKGKGKGSEEPKEENKSSKRKAITENEENEDEPIKKKKKNNEDSKKREKRLRIMRNLGLAPPLPI